MTVEVFEADGVDLDRLNRAVAEGEIALREAEEKGDTEKARSIRAIIGSAKLAATAVSRKEEAPFKALRGDDTFAASVWATFEAAMQSGAGLFLADPETMTGIGTAIAVLGVVRLAELQASS